jgi:hypothetical protein
MGLQKNSATSGKDGRARSVKITYDTARTLDRHICVRARHVQAHRPQLSLAVNDRGPLTTAEFITTRSWSSLSCRTSGWFRLSARSISSRIWLVHLACTQSCLGDPDQQIPQRVRIEHVGVVDHDECHRSVQPQFLTQPGQLIRSLTAAEVIPAPVSAQILKPDPAVRAYQTERDVP